MNTFIVISDIHFPYHDEKALRALKDFHKNLTLDYIMLNGDILDFYDVSKYDKDPDRINSLQKELNIANKFMKELRVLHPESKIIFIQGNHENRLERYLKRHPELYSLDALKLENILGLKELNIQYQPKEYKLGPLLITHGSIIRKFSGYSAHAELDKNDCSGISGHCFSEDVEVLTPRGWIPIIDINKGGLVGTYNKTSGAFEFNRVNEKFVYDNYDKLYHIKSMNIDIMTTDKHGFIGFNSNNKLKEFTAEQLSTMGNIKIPLACKYNTTQLPMKDDMIRLLVNISADGSIEGNNIRFHLRKTQKINHLIELLDRLNFKYSVHKQTLGTTKINILKESAREIITLYFNKGIKVLPERLADANAHQAKVILEEYSITDGNKNSSAKNSYQIYTSKREEVDLLQAIFAKNGIRTSVIAKQNSYIITANTKYYTSINGKDRTKVVPYKGKVSCVCVNNGTLVVRSKGKTIVTQNTHRLNAFYKKTPNRYMSWYEGGCLCDIEPEYVFKPNWQQGFIYGTFNKDGYNVITIPITNGKIRIPQQIYKENQ